jgi:hypothetical protein
VARGVGFRVATGVRLRAARGGPRLALGPQVARVQVGGGRTATPSGRGHATVWTTLSGGGHETPTTPGRAGRRKADEWATIRAHLDALLTAHEQPVRSATRPVVPAPPPVSRRALRRQRYQQSTADLAGVAIVARVRAWRDSWQDLDAQVAAADAAARERHAAEQAAADAWWQRLVANDPEVVAERLEEALTDHALPATVTAVEDRRASLVIAVDPPDKLVGTREPTLTDAGNLTLRRTNQTRTHALYQAAITSAMLAVAAEAFAVAPGLTSVELAVIDPRHLNGPSVLVLAHLPRAAVLPEGVDRPVASDLVALAEAGDATLVVDRGGRIGAWRPLSATAVPEVAMLLDSLDVE